MAHKPNLETNKIFAAILVAGIVAMLAGFIAKKIVHPQELKEPAVKIDVSAYETIGDSSAPAKPQLPEPILALLADADLERGQKLAKACMACHSFDKGGSNGIGPNLWDVVGGPIAHLDSFSYSDALETLHDEGKSWDYQQLNAFLWKPKTYAPGTKMNYIGIKKPQDRAAVIAWLRTLSDAPKALPTAEEIAAEMPEPEDSGDDSTRAEDPAASEDQTNNPALHSDTE